MKHACGPDTGLLVLIALSLTLASCSSDTATGNDTARLPPTTPEQPPTSSPVPAPVSVAPAITTTSACGTLPVSPLSVSTDANSPTQISAGMLVSGEIDPQTPGNQTHAWSLDLLAGSYAVVLDSQTANGANTNIGLGVDMRVNGGDARSIIRGNQIDTRNREAVTLDLNQSARVLLMIEPTFRKERYTLGVIASGEPVPSPYFTDCPLIRPLVLGATEQFVLGPESGGGADDVWFQGELPVGDYQLDHVATHNQSGNIIYDVTALEDVGQSSAATKIDRVNELGFTSSQSSRFEMTRSQAVWLRFRPAEFGYAVTSKLYPIVQP